MIKRLALSLVLMGLAAFALGAGAVAYFTDSGTGHVTITAGDTDITFDIDQDCNGGPVHVDDEYTFTWSDIVPGDTTVDCITVNNAGDGDLELYVRNNPISGSALQAALRFTWYESDDTTVVCPTRVPNAAVYTTANSNKGCDLGFLSHGSSTTFRVHVDFFDDGTNQNALENAEYTMDAVLTGYTG